MSRSGYSDCCVGWEFICWRGAVNSAIKGARGQAFLIELAAALDAMPEKILIPHYLESDGQVCALGAVGKKRGIEMGRLDVEDSYWLSKVFGIAEAMVKEIEYVNDEYDYYGDDEKLRNEKRWKRLRAWVDEHLISQAQAV